MKPDIDAILQDVIKEKLRVINENREKLIEAWIAETGLLPSESVLVEDRSNPMVLKIWIERRTEPETLKS